MRLVRFTSSDGSRVGRLDGDEVVELDAADLPEILESDTWTETGRRFSRRSIELEAPISRPPSIRDFIAYPDQLNAKAKRRGTRAPTGWQRSPAFHFANPAGILGPSQPVVAQPGVRALDFEVEVAAVIGAGSKIAGFGLLCDWTDRAMEQREIAAGIGPHKSKDFGTTLGPWIATPEELPYRDGMLELELAVKVNGRLLSRPSTSGAWFSWSELVLVAARGTRLVPGDLLSSGALPGGSLIEIGASALDRDTSSAWLVPGDTVEVSCEQLGELSVSIG